MVVVAGIGALPQPPTPASAAASDKTPRITELRCLSDCAGARSAAIGGKIVLGGRHLAGVDQVSFDGDPAAIAAAPSSAAARRVTVSVPSGAVSGRPEVTTTQGDDATAPRKLTIATASEVPAAGRIRLTASRVKPRRAFFDQPGDIKLSYRFAASGRTGVRVEVVRKRGSKRVRSWREPGQVPFTRHNRTWNGLERDGDIADDGTYRFRVGGFGRRSVGAGALKLFGYRFPVRGSHRYGGSEERFGAPRSGGRTHQGQDVFAACGTRLEAARGGRVQVKAYDGSLYGHYVVIDARRTRADHMYVHMSSPSTFGRGDRVRTGQRIGSVGRSGNASAEPCQLHFELWPAGWRRGRPVDPLPALRRWDGWS